MLPVIEDRNLYQSDFFFDDQICHRTVAHQVLVTRDKVYDISAKKFQQQNL